MISLLRREPRALAFGFMYTLGSSPGQTFFISVFVPAIAASLATGVPEVSFLYAMATLASALTLPFLGRLIDRIDLVRFGLAVGLMLTVAGFAIAAAAGPLSLFAGFYALRLFGQGLMSHTGVTATARYFREDRGKALALTSLGFAAGEALLAVTAVLLIELIGWRWSFVAAGSVLGILTAAAAAWQVRHMHAFRRPVARAADGSGKRSSIWRSAYIWWLMPVFLASPYVLTAVIFYQGMIARELGLTLALFAGSFVAYALARIPGSLVAGPLVDRYSGRALLPIQLLPGALGLAILASFGSVWSVILYYALIGFTSGLDGTIRSAAVAEMVHPSELGAARSNLTSLAVLSTAAGPATIGLLLGVGISLTGTLWLGAAFFLAASLLAFFANLHFGVTGGESARLAHTLGK
jgi:MFS family permease